MQSFKVLTPQGKKGRVYTRRKGGYYYLSYTDSTGKRYQVSLNTQDARQAKTRALTHLANQGVTLSYIRYAWMDAHQTRSVAYCNDVRRFMEQFINYMGDRIPETISHQDIINYHTFLVTRTKRSGQDKDKGQLSSDHVGVQLRTIW